MGFVGGILVVLAVMLPVMAVCGVMCLLQAVGLYTLARRRGIRRPWLAWLPVANLWILGSISDQYQHLVIEYNASGLPCFYSDLQQKGSGDAPGKLFFLQFIRICDRVKLTIKKEVFL